MFTSAEKQVNNFLRQSPRIKHEVRILRAKLSQCSFCFLRAASHDLTIEVSLALALSFPSFSFPSFELPVLSLTLTLAFHATSPGSPQRHAWRRLRKVQLLRPNRISLPSLELTPTSLRKPTTKVIFPTTKERLLPSTFTTSSSTSFARRRRARKRRSSRRIHTWVAGTTARLSFEVPHQLRQNTWPRLAASHQLYHSAQSMLMLSRQTWQHQLGKVDHRLSRHGLHGFWLPELWAATPHNPRQSRGNRSCDPDRNVTGRAQTQTTQTKSFFHMILYWFKIKQKQCVITFIWSKPFEIANIFLVAWSCLHSGANFQIPNQMAPI